MITLYIFRNPAGFLEAKPHRKFQNMEMEIHIPVILSKKLATIAMLI
jgi:hypothetical protein